MSDLAERAEDPRARRRAGVSPSAGERPPAPLSASHEDAANPKLVDANEVVKSLEARVRVLADDIRVEVDLDPRLSPVSVGSRWLERILMNLAVNARHASPHGGDLTITTENVSVGQFSQQHRSVLADNYVCITVRDNGQRMTKEAINRILEPFFTTTPRDEGTGVGLATVYGILTRALGIQVETDLRGGTSFRIFLPATETAATAASKGESGSAPPSGKLVLVVEEAVAMRRLISRALTKAGYEVKSAGGAGKALELLERLDRPVDVLLVDVVMPGLGKLLADRVSRQYPNVMILYMSGDPDQVESRSQYLQKPFTKQELVDKVNSLVTDSIAV